MKLSLLIATLLASGAVHASNIIRLQAPIALPPVGYVYTTEAGPWIADGPVSCGEWFRPQSEYYVEEQVQQNRLCEQNQYMTMERWATNPKTGEKVKVGDVPGTREEDKKQYHEYRTVYGTSNCYFNYAPIAGPEYTVWYQYLDDNSSQIWWKGVRVYAGPNAGNSITINSVTYSWEATNMSQGAAQMRKTCISQ